MFWNDFLRALALFFVLEGILPFAFPRSWGGNLLRLANLSPEKIRVLGFSMMLIGVSLSLVAHTI